MTECFICQTPYIGGQLLACDCEELTFCSRKCQDAESARPKTARHVCDAELLAARLPDVVSGGEGEEEGEARGGTKGDDFVMATKDAKQQPQQQQSKSRAEDGKARDTANRNRRLAEEEGAASAAALDGPTPVGGEVETEQQADEKEKEKEATCVMCAMSISETCYSCRVKRGDELLPLAEACAAFPKDDPVDACKLSLPSGSVELERAPPTPGGDWASEDAYYQYSGGGGGGGMYGQSAYDEKEEIMNLIYVGLIAAFVLLCLGLCVPALSWLASASPQNSFGVFVRRYHSYFSTHVPLKGIDDAASFAQSVASNYSYGGFDFEFWSGVWLSLLFLAHALAEFMMAMYQRALQNNDSVLVEEDPICEDKQSYSHWSWALLGLAAFARVSLADLLLDNATVRLSFQTLLAIYFSTPFVSRKTTQTKVASVVLSACCFLLSVACYWAAMASGQIGETHLQVLMCFGSVSQFCYGLATLVSGLFCDDESEDERLRSLGYLYDAENDRWCEPGDEATARIARQQLEERTPDWAEAFGPAANCSRTLAQAAKTCEIDNYCTPLVCRLWVWCLLWTSAYLF